ncbi:helix-turn-helix domain-containing protein [Clostridium uliginosum]|uniref:AraC-type DNA-binding protein n=1 Tax=Clostridium uliginosum TaxID=119641 RepID=A0A1I1RE19_9CLOT|nr:AraC family transcriptional regulator [Clostridium uliginosum]SFD32492.1 AraC-type DNA-binding protein [Clostridium uliginosum]
MESTYKEKLLYGSKIIVIKREKKLNIYKVEDNTGSGIMTSYNILDGIELVYNDIHMESASIDLNPPEGIFEINHCREGRIECEFKNGEFLYMSKDDFSINRKNGTCHQSYFPLSHYHGISICLEIDKAQKEIDKYLPHSCIDLKKLCNRLCKNSSFMIMKANESIGHIFAELYSVPERIKLEYFKIKILEIVLFLSTIGESKEEKREYYTKRQVEVIKNIQKQIIENIQNRYTLEELSHKHDIALTTMKKCFKGVYGKSIYSYMREYRMKIAAERLISTNDNILIIANFVGYENGSKFASAFKEIVGLSPREFRKNRE